MSEVVLSVPVDAGGVDPLLASLEKINENLKQINLSSKGSFDIMSKGIEGANKKLAKTDKIFGDIFKKMKLSGLMSMGGKVIGAGAGLLGISTGAMLFGSLMNAGKNIGTTYEAKGVGLSTAEMKSLEVASQLTTKDAGTLPAAIKSMTDALNNTEMWGNFPKLGTGLNAEQLKTMPPEEAFEKILNSVMGQGQGAGSQYIRDAFNAILGGAVDYNVAESTKGGFGTKVSKAFDEQMKAFSKIDFDELNRGAESLIKFQAQLDIVSSKIGSNLADPLSDILTKLTPALDKFATAIATFLDNITQEDIDSFVKGIETVFTFIGGLAGGLLQDTSNTKSTNLAFSNESKEGNTTKILGMTTNAMLQGVMNLFSKEGREENERVGIERSLQSWINSGYDPEGIRKTSPEMFKQFEQGGYISGGKFTQKAQQAVTIIVKSPEEAAKVTNNLNNNIGVQGVKK